jgi:NADH-quinone oxidoreductase subunit E
MSSFFSTELNKKIKEYLGRYETKRSSILPILHAVQDENDWISPEAVQALETEHGLSVVDVNEVLSFYTMYRQDNRGCEKAHRRRQSSWKAGAFRMS